MSAPRIVIDHILPPIPTRNLDWCAYREGMEEGQVYGYGPTPVQAIEQLLDTEEMDKEIYE